MPKLQSGRYGQTQFQKGFKLLTILSVKLNTCDEMNQTKAHNKTSIDNSPIIIIAILTYGNQA